MKISQKKIFSAVLILIPALILAFLSVHFFLDPAASRPKSYFDPNQYFDPNGSCLGNVRQYDMSFRHKLYLNKHFMPSGAADSDALYPEAIREQLNYLTSTLAQYQDGLPVRQTAISFDERNIHVDHVTEVEYPFDLVIDEPENFKRSSIPHPYMEQAIERGQTSRDDKAVRVDYHATMRLLLCVTDDSIDPGKLRLPLPKDPYLAFWYVSQKDRRHLKWRSDGPVEFTNPCANTEIVDLYLPEDYWYAWDPYKKGEGEKGGRFDCSKILFQGDQYDLVSAELRLKTSAYKNPFDFSRFDQDLSDPIRTSIALSLSDNYYYSTFNTDRLSRLIEDFLEVESFRKAKRLLPYWDEQDEDLGMNSILILLWNINRMIALEHREIRVLDKYAKIQLQGTYKKSGKRARITIYFGPTGYHTDDSNEFREFFTTSLQKDDIVLYNGHAGLGHNISKGLLKKFYEKHVSDRSVTIENKKQLVGIFTCEAYTYYPPEEFIYSQEDEAEFDRDIIYMTGSNRDLYLRALTYVLQSVDRFYSGEKHIPFYDFSYKTGLDGMYFVR